MKTTGVAEMHHLVFLYIPVVWVIFRFGLSKINLLSFPGVPCQEYEDELKALKAAQTADSKATWSLQPVALIPKRDTKKTCLPAKSFSF